jgi:RNA polymerase sigma-70 factor (ECF subfamily)
MVAATTPSPGDRPGRLDPERVTASRREALVDSALVSRFNDGDETAFVAIVSRHRDRLFHIAFDVLRNHADAEEITQDALIRAHRNLARFRGESSLSTWLCCITINLSRNRLRYHRRRMHHVTLPLDATLGDDSPDTFADLVACGAPSPIREVVNKEFAFVVSACSELLAPRQREILAMRTSQHRSYSAIGRMLGVHTGTVKSRLARARQSLRELVSKAYPEFDRDADPSGPFESLRPATRLEVTGA